MSKNKDLASNPHYDNIYSQGGVAAPSGATLRKYFRAPKEAKRKDTLDGNFLTISEGTLNDTLYGTTDYHEAMMNNIAMMREGEPVWTFRKRSKSQRKIDNQAFGYTQRIREIYGVNKKDTYYVYKLEERAEENQKRLEKTLALKILALEEIDKNWFKGYLPHRMYRIIKKQAKISLDLADKEYKAKGGKDSEIRKKALDYMIAELKK